MRKSSHGAVIIRDTGYPNRLTMQSTSSLTNMWIRSISRDEPTVVINVILNTMGNDRVSRAYLRHPGRQRSQYCVGLRETPAPAEAVAVAAEVGWFLCE